MPTSRLFVGVRRWLALGQLALLLLTIGCNEASPPPRVETLYLKGTPYERGLQHGKLLSSKIKSFYTTMLRTSLLPYLNREQPDISAVLKTYDPAVNPEYGNGQFSLRLLQESALELEKDIPQAYRDEMRGIADGAGVPYEEVLILNTFVDSVLAARAVTYFLRQAGAPVVGRLEILSDSVLTDLADNDDDGQTDEANEGRVDYAASPTATFVEVPADVKFRFRLTDPDGVRPESVRILVDGKVYAFGDSSLQIEPFVTGSGEVSKDTIVVTWTPPTQLPTSSVVTIGIQAGDGKLLTNPPPSRYRTMRTEQFTITTRGLGKRRWEVANLGKQDNTTQPPSNAFALRGTATQSGEPLMGAHFALLDAGTSHKHCVIQVHTPSQGPTFAFAGWAGLIYGFSGVSSRGVAFAANMSDTLSNPLVKQVKDKLLNAKLLSSGEPVGFVARRVLETANDAVEAAELARTAKHSFGWNFLFSDKDGQLRAVEAYSRVLDEQAEPAAYGPETAEPGAADPYGRPWSSVRTDDLRQSVSYRALANDLEASILYDLKPQRFWSSYYYPSQRAFARLGALIDAGYGQFTVDKAIETLRDPLLVDRNDSMQASVIEPKQRRIRFAAGKVPAVEAEFRVITLPAPIDDPASGWTGGTP